MRGASGQELGATGKSGAVPSLPPSPAFCPELRI